MPIANSGGARQKNGMRHQVWDELAQSRISGGGTTRRIAMAFAFFRSPGRRLLPLAKAVRPLDQLTTVETLRAPGLVQQSITRHPAGRPHLADFPESLLESDINRSNSSLTPVPFDKRSPSAQ